MTPPRSLRQEQAARLLRKAAQDEVLLDVVLDQPRVYEETFGYHVQQAVEKLLKAVLAAHGVVYRRTHNLDELLLLLEQQGITLPDDLRPLRAFTTFAVEPRYEDTLTGQAPLDRRATYDLVRQLRVWVEARVSEAP